MLDIIIYDTHKGSTLCSRRVQRGEKEFVTFEMVIENPGKQEGSQVENSPLIFFTICQENSVTILGASQTCRLSGCISPCLLQVGPQRQCLDGHSEWLSHMFQYHLLDFHRHVLHSGNSYMQVLICRSQTGHEVLHFWQAPNTSDTVHSQTAH